MFKHFIILSCLIRNGEIMFNVMFRCITPFLNVLKVLYLVDYLRLQLQLSCLMYTVRNAHFLILLHLFNHNCAALSLRM